MTIDLSTIPTWALDLLLQEREQKVRHEQVQGPNS